MELNIQKIADEKIHAMHESGKIVSAIETGVESIVLKAIENALNGYEIKRKIEKQISESISSVISDIGFPAYNGLISQKIKDITEGVMRDDVVAKIQKRFDELLVMRHDGIKLSEIINAYRKYLFESVDESDKWEYRNFTCEISEKADGIFTWYTVRLHGQPLSRSKKPEIEFIISVHEKKESAPISMLFVNGKYEKDSFKLGTINKIEALLANLYYNETPIILDIDDIDDDDHYDIND